MVTDTRETNDSTKLEEKEENANTDLEAGRISDDHTSSDDGANEDDTSIHSSGHHSAHGDCGADTIIASPITRLSTNVSLGPDNPVEHYSSFVDVPDAVYDRIPRRRKLVIVALLSYCAFLAPISSTTVLSATPEIAKEFGTSEDIINVTNALYMLFMGISPIVWGPFSEVWGRKIVRCSAWTTRTRNMLTHCATHADRSPARRRCSSLGAVLGPHCPQTWQLFSSFES